MGKGFKMSVRVTYEHELGLLNQDLMEMAHMVERAIEQTFTAFEDQDFQMAEDIIKGDRTVNDMERAIEARCLSLILRQQPVAGDLRQVSTALKVVTDLERIGNHLSDMAELFVRMDLPELSRYSSAFPDMVRETRTLIGKAARAFVERNMAMGQEAIDADDGIDDFFNQIKEDLVKELKKDGSDADGCVDALMTAKYLEKIGDHGVNIGQWEIFQETGEIDEIRLL